MRLLFVGDFLPFGGYSTILRETCAEAASLVEQVTLLGLNWDRSEHNYPFQVIPSDFSWVPVQVMRLCEAMQFDNVILTMDVPKILSLLSELERQRIEWPSVSGLFPIESDPLLLAWQEGLNTLDHRFVISEFAQQLLSEIHIDSTWLPMTAQPPVEAIDKDEARRRLSPLVRYGDSERLHKDTGHFVVTVADNQERKALPVIAEAIATLRNSGTWVNWLLVTQPENNYGWDLHSLWQRLWMNDQVLMFDHLTQGELSWVYQAADAFVLASQAEGACLPLYEAMAHGVPCVAPMHTAIKEALDEGRGELVAPDHTTIHPWGNVNRYHTQPSELATALDRLLLGDNENTIKAARQLIERRSWKDVAVRIVEALDGKTNESIEEEATESAQAGQGTVQRSERSGRRELRTRVDATVVRDRVAQNG